MIQQHATWVERLQRREASPYPEIWNILDQVKDPEIPVISLWELGVLCDVSYESGNYVISITPTYSGCPAMETMRSDVISTLAQAGINEVRVRTQLAPAWTTQNLSPAGKAKLQEYGIAPPDPEACGSCGLTPDAGIKCPRCGSLDTQRISEFGSTACKALFQCQQCLEPFDYFKHI